MGKQQYMLSGLSFLDVHAAACRTEPLRAGARVRIAEDLPLSAQDGHEVRHLQSITQEPTSDETLAAPQSDSAARRRAAVLRCCQSRIDAVKAALEQTVMHHPNWCYYEQSKGYCKALPDIVDYESTLDFIACVISGMGIRVIEAKEGSKLLYGAQVALSAYREKG
jgi:hypothetical protein